MLDSVRSQYETTARNGRTQNLAHLREPRKPMPDQATLDQAADRAFHGGYRMWRKNTCPDCREARSVVGTCGC